MATPLWQRAFALGGGTQDMLPYCVLTNIKPTDLRLVETITKEKAEQLEQGTYVPKLLEHLDLHDRLDNEKIRHAQFPGSSKFWIYLKTLGEVGVFFYLQLHFSHLHQSLTTHK